MAGALAAAFAANAVSTNRTRSHPSPLSQHVSGDYEQHRAPRTRRVVEASAVATTFFQFKSETTDEMRQFFRDGNFGSRDWVYSYDALGVDLANLVT